MKKSEETKEPEALQGGPGGDINEKTEESAELKVSEETTEEPKKPIYSGLTGEFTSVDELVEHTRQLEKKIFEKKVQESKPEPEEPKLAAAPDDEEIANAWYVDPSKAQRLVIDRAKKELRDELERDKRTKTAEEEFYTDLYSKNPDLKSMQRVVKSVVTEKWGTIKNMSPEDAKKFIAKESRAFAGDLKSSWGIKETELPQGQVITTRSGGAAPQKSRVEAPKILSFGEQLKQMQARYSKSG